MNHFYFTHTAFFCGGQGCPFICLFCQFVSISPLSHKPWNISGVSLSQQVTTQGHGTLFSVHTTVDGPRPAPHNPLGLCDSSSFYISFFITVICFLLDEPRCAWESNGEYPIAATCCASYAPSLSTLCRTFCVFHSLPLKPGYIGRGRLNTLL